jgi:hypothetical protein
MTPRSRTAIGSTTPTVCICTIKPSSIDPKRVTKLWRWRYRWRGAEKLIALGGFPEIGLKEARRLCDGHRATLRAGTDPSAVRAAAKLRPSGARMFEHIARDWWHRQQRRWRPGHAKDVLGSLEADVFPRLGRLDIGEIETPLVLAVQRKIEARGAVDTAHRVAGRIGKVFAFAISSGIAVDNPALVVPEALEPLTPLARAQQLLRGGRAVHQQRGPLANDPEAVLQIVAPVVVAQHLTSADCITNTFGFDFRQGQDEARREAKL